MKKVCKVSVIIPMYNAEKYLGECIDSLLSQTLKDIELICVDDGSTDGTKEIIEAYMSKDKRVKMLHQQNLGAGAARNKGLAEAKGEYLVFLDADDFFEPDMLELQYNNCKEHSADMGLCRADSYDDSNGVYNDFKRVLQKKFVKEEPFCLASVGNNIFRITNTAPWTKMFAAEFVRKHDIKFQCLPRANDVYFTMLSLVLADKIVTVDKTLVHYRTNMTTDSHILNNEKDPLAFIKALAEVKEKLQQEGIFEDVKIAFANSAVVHFTYNLNKFKLNKKIYDMIMSAIVDEYFISFGVDALDAKSAFNKYEYDLLIKRIDSFNTPKITISKFTSNAEYEDDNPLVSVIVPAYNTQEYIGQCLDSLLAQTLKNIEIICINDGSDDRTLHIMENYAVGNSNIKVISQKNQGTSVARNRGLEAASGKYIVFLDSDDMLASDALDTLYGTCSANNLDVLCFDAEVIHDEEYVGKIIEYKERREFSELYDGISFLSLMRAEGAYRGSACFMILKKEFLMDNCIRFYNGILHEDELFSFYVYMNVRRCSHISNKFYIRRMRPLSIMTRQVSGEHVYGYFTVMKEMIKYGMSFDHNSEKAAEIAKQYRRIQYSAVNRYLEIPKIQRKQILFKDAFEEALFDMYIIKEANRREVKLSQKTKSKTKTQKKESCETNFRTVKKISKKLKKLIKL